MSQPNKANNTPKPQQIHSMILSNGTGVMTAFKATLNKLFAKNPCCKNIAMVFAVGGRHEVVFLRRENKAERQIAKLKDRQELAITI